MLNHLTENVVDCTMKQEEANEFTKQIREMTNVAGKQDVEKNQTVVEEFKKIMFWIKQNRCDQDAKALSNNTTKKVGKTPGFQNGIRITNQSGKDRG